MTNNRKVLSAAILCVLAKSALGIEVEPNNDSSKANPLGTENVGQLSSGGDVDFFSIENKCISYPANITYTATDEKENPRHIKGTSHVKGECIKFTDSCARYTADDAAANPSNKNGECKEDLSVVIKGEVQYRSEISLAFSCDSRATVAIGSPGWYLGILDLAGVLQKTYQIKPDDCTVGASGSKGPYSFKFPSLPDAKYYLSTVGDCHLPIYSIPQSSNPVIGVNLFVQSTTATAVDIKTAKDEISKAQPSLDAAIKALNDASNGKLTDTSGKNSDVKFSVIGSNASIAQASDALLTANDIATTADTNFKAGITTAATTINAVSSTAKAVKIMSDAMVYLVQAHTLFLIADAAAKDPAIQKTIDDADAEVTRLETVVKNASASDTTATPADREKATSDKAKADNAKKAAENTKANLTQIQKDTKADDDDATKQLGEANKALSDSVAVLNTTVKEDIASSNAATNAGSRTNNACDVSNTATYTIKDNQDTSPKITPYLDIPAKNPPALGLQSSAQTGSAYDVDFFTVKGNSLTEIPLEFSCTKNSAKGSTEGWVVSAWRTDKDKPEFAYQIAPKDCNSANPYTLTLPKYSGSYYVGIQSACALAPSDKSTVLQLIYYNLTGNPTDSSLNYLCDINTASFTIKQGEIANVLDLTNLTTDGQLISSKKGAITKPTVLNPEVISNVYYIDSTNPKSDIPLLFSCTKDAQRFTNDWKLSIYNEAKILLSSQLINGSACGEGLDGDTGKYKFPLPSGSSRYYLSVTSACASAEDKSCQLDSSEYTISRDVILAPATTADTAPKIETITPYLDIAGKSPLALKAQTRGRVSNLKMVNLYSQLSSPLQDVNLEFSCDKSKAIGNNFGWVMTVWDHDSAGDLLQAAYEIKPTECDNSTADATYKVTIPSSVNVSYVGIQSICLPVPTENKSALDVTLSATCKVNTGYYTIKSDFNAKLDSSALKIAVPLGADKSGQINASTDNDIYVVESDGTAKMPMLFSCSPMALRQTDDWKLSVYDDSNELVAGFPMLINGSVCGSGFKGDKGGYKFNLPSGSLRYYLSIKSVCNTPDCVVDTSEYNIARDVTKTYVGVLATAKTITTKTANFNLTRCGSNPKANVAVKAENVNLSKKLTPVRIQIGGIACQTTVPTVANSLAGTVVNPSTIFDSTLIAKDNATVVLGDCGAVKGKVTLTGTGLDLENLNPENALDSVSIPVKIDMGDFHCSGKDIFYMTTDDATGDISYSNNSPKIDTTPIITPPPVVIPPVVTPPVKIPDSFDTSWLLTKKNLGASQVGQIKSFTDMQIYQVDTGTADANLTFSCSNSVRYQNDWTVLIYDNKQALKSKTLINGSSCGTGQPNDTGAYAISLTKDSPTYYLVVKSACESSDPTCVVDSSQYQIKHVTAAQAAATSTTTPCFSGSCTPITTKPFFN